MTIKVTLEFANAAELVAYFSATALPVEDTPVPANRAERKKKKDVAVGNSQPEVEQNTGSGASVFVGQPSTEGATVVVEGVATTVASSEVQADAADAAAATIEQVRAALARINETHGILKAKELLTMHGASRISELKPEQYGSFVAAAEKV